MSAAASIASIKLERTNANVAELAAAALHQLHGFTDHEIGWLAGFELDGVGEHRGGEGEDGGGGEELHLDG